MVASHNNNNNNKKKKKTTTTSGYYRARSSSEEEAKCMVLLVASSDDMENNSQQQQHHQVDEDEDDDDDEKEERRVLSSSSNSSTSEATPPATTTTTSSSSSSAHWLQLALPDPTAAAATTTTTTTKTTPLMLDLNLRDSYASYAPPPPPPPPPNIPLLYSHHHHPSNYPNYPYPHPPSALSAGSLGLFDHDNPWSPGGRLMMMTSAPGPSSHLKFIHPPHNHNHPSTSPLWFCLVPSLHSSGQPFLPHLSKRFLRIKDGRMTVGIVIKYVSTKLGLDTPSQVEIRCRGQILLPFLTLQHVRDQIWSPSHTVNLLPDSLASHHIMLLHYGRITSSPHT